MCARSFRWWARAGRAAGSSGCWSFSSASCFSALDYGLIYWSEQFIDSGLTAMLFATLPLITILVAHLYLPGEPITMRKLGGTLLAFLGAVALFGDHLRLDPETGGPDGRGRRRRRRVPPWPRGDQAARFGAPPGVAQRAGDAHGRGGVGGGVARGR